nr:hypothetical protein [Tanacetum cinerariifolium]
MTYHPVITENQSNPIAGFRDLNTEFEERNNNSSNEVNAASSSVSIAGQNSINSTNDFNVAGPSRFEDPENPDKVYKVVKALCQSFEKLMKGKFHMSSMGELTFFLGLQVKKKKDGIFISQDKYVAEILKKFRLSERKLASTLIDAEKPLLKVSNGEYVDVHTYRSMIGSLMYLTSLRPDIMFAVCACAQFQVTPKVSHLNAVKRIFRYLKGKPYLGLWYPNDSPFDLVAYSDSDYVVVATSSTEAEYVDVASGCAQVLWIQNHLLDYGFNCQYKVFAVCIKFMLSLSTAGCYLRNVVIEIAVLSDDLSIITNGIQLTHASCAES